jgi:HD-GYP domain-containing protein (c-di-GMP phosphodiesterase class II)
MAAKFELMFDTSHVREIYIYLFDNHRVHAVAVDDQGAVTIPNETAVPDSWSAVQKYPFASADLGGLRCTAPDADTLVKAEPHIKICLHAVDTLIAREMELQETGNEMLELSKQLTFLYSLAKKIIGVTQIDTFCEIVLREISEAINADRAYIQLADNIESRTNFIIYRMEAEVAQLIAREKAFQDSVGEQTVIISLQDKTSALIAPIAGHDQMTGYMAFFREADKRFFTAYEKKFVGIIDNIISPSLQTILLYNSLQELYLNTVKALAAAIDAKDEYTHGHSYRVAKYSKAIGRNLALKEKDLNDLEIAAYMHDLGKIGVAENILGKPGRLTDAEFDAVKQHPSLTNKILEPIHLPRFIMEGAVMHHERIDGTGYPFGLKGDEIPLFARIIAVADVFDALTSARPYRAAMTVEKAISILKEEVPAHFDARMVLGLVDELCNHRVDCQDELADIYCSLEYVDIDHLNDFLVEITENLIPSDSRETCKLPDIAILR